jgi:hypothetical protein
MASASTGALATLMLVFSTSTTDPKEHVAKGVVFRGSAEPRSHESPGTNLYRMGTNGFGDRLQHLVVKCKQVVLRCHEPLGVSTSS